MSDSLQSGAHRAPRWIDAFPWIPDVAGDTGGVTECRQHWWLEPIAESESTVRHQRLSSLPAVMLKRLRRETMGQVFPILPAAIELASLSITTRGINSLHRFGYQRVADLRDLEIGELLDLPYVGIGTVSAILRALADASTLPSVQESYARSQPMIDDLTTVATWQAALGMPASPLLGGPVPPGSPPPVIAARRRLELISANDVLTGELAEPDFVELLEGAIGKLDDRSVQVLARRSFAERPDTLDRIAADLGVTRERVRQIESRARAHLVEALDSGCSLGAVSTVVRELVGTALPLAELLRQVPALAHHVRTVAEPAWRVLEGLDAAYEIKDGWCAAPTIERARAEALTRLQERANRHGVVMIDDLDPLNPSQSGESARACLRDWLVYCGCDVDDAWVFTRLHSIGDRAAAILSVVGSPMASRDILARLGARRNLVALKNVMTSDDRFDRVDRDQWGLSEWGAKSYRGIKALVGEEVAHSGGEIPVDKLIERIAGRYAVSANSVITYASSPPFEARGGIVRFCTGAPGSRKQPARTKRLYRRPDSWLYRVKVTKDHLRGSGSAAPVALAVALGIGHGQVRRLAARLGPQTLAWTANQPTFGSIRRLLAGSCAEVGSEIFLVIGDDGSFHIEPVIAGDGNPLERALHLVGVTSAAARSDPIAALAAAIGMPEGTSVASVIDSYRKRGETDIAELLSVARDELEERWRSAFPRAS